MLNPIRNMERFPGAGGPEEAGLEIAPRRSGFSALRHRPHNYPVTRGHTTIVHIGMPERFDEGGPVEETPDAPDAMDLREPADQLSPRDAQLREIVVNAMAALRGENPDPEPAIQAFIQTFGADEYQDLRRMVLGQDKGRAPGDEGDGEDENEPEPDDGEDDTAPAAGGMQVGGLLKGPGSGQSDEIEAATPSGRKVLLSDGEYVIDAPTVAALGDGSTSAGARRLDALRKEVRRQAYGHEKQAKTMSKGGRALLLALQR